MRPSPLLHVPAGDGALLGARIASARSSAEPSAPALVGARARGTVVLTHGYSLDTRCWNGVLPSLTGAGWRAVSWDLRGHGYSRAGMAGRGPFTVEQAVADLCAVVNLVDRAFGGPVALVGHSMGGMVTQAALPELGEKVVGIALISTTPGGEELRALAAARWGSVVYRHGPRLARVRPAVSLGAVATGHRVRPAALGTYLGALEAFAAPTLEELAAPAPGPVLLVAAGRDHLIPAAALASLVQRHPDARVLEVPGAGHEVMCERPEIVGPVMAAWLGECAS